MRFIQWPVCDIDSVDIVKEGCEQCSNKYRLSDFQILHQI